MSDRTLVPDTDEKLDQILGAAQKRFGMYGFEKSTMQEIANDLGISKPLLYYYFSDKAMLFRAVIAKEQKEFLEMVKTRVITQEKPSLMLKEYVVLRTEYFRKYINLSKLRLASFNSFRPVIHELVSDLHEKELRLIKEILEKGTREKEFFVDDPTETAQLFFEILRGIRWGSLHKKELIAVTDEDYNKTRRLTEGFFDLFIRGISVKSSS